LATYAGERWCVWIVWDRGMGMGMGIPGLSTIVGLWNRRCALCLLISPCTMCGVCIVLTIMASRGYVIRGGQIFVSVWVSVRCGSGSCYQRGLPEAKPKAKVNYYIYMDVCGCCHGPTVCALICSWVENKFLLIKTAAQLVI